VAWEEEEEVAPLKASKMVRVQWREDEPNFLKVQLVLRVERPAPRMPDPKEALLCYVDVNTNFGLVAVYALFDGTKTKILETPKLKPPNRTPRLRMTAKRKEAAAYGCKRGVNLALARLSERFKARGWVKAAVAKIFEKAFQRADGRSVMVNFDIPDYESVKNSYLLSVRKVAANLSNWFGVYAMFECYPSTRCPCCAELEIVHTRRTRMSAEGAASTTIEITVPFHRWCKALGLPLPGGRCESCRRNCNYRYRTNRKPRAYVGGVALNAAPLPQRAPGTPSRSKMKLEGGARSDEEQTPPWAPLERWQRG
jgi:hypothetical protein